MRDAVGELVRRAREAEPDAEHGKSEQAGRDGGQPNMSLTDCRRFLRRTRAAVVEARTLIPGAS